MEDLDQQISETIVEKDDHHFLLNYESCAMGISRHDRWDGWGSLLEMIIFGFQPSQNISAQRIFVVIHEMKFIIPVNFFLPQMNHNGTQVSSTPQHQHYHYQYHDQSCSHTFSKRPSVPNSTSHVCPLWLALTGPQECDMKCLWEWDASDSVCRMRETDSMSKTNRDKMIDERACD